jgi:acetoin utilization deacetylase AcuC-like enzyme
MASLWRRWVAGRRLRDAVGIWYHPGYEMTALERSARVPAIDLYRSQRVLGHLLEAGVVRTRDLRRAPPASLTDLARVHSLAYLESVTRPELLGRIFGLEPDEVDVDQLLGAQRLAAGGTAAAATWAAERPRRVACNLGGGFHHAEPENGSGFCVYNDIAVAIAVLRAQGWTAPIAIVDLDFHQGNGNIVTYATDPLVLTYSLHGAAWSHVEAIADQQHLLPVNIGDAGYLDRLGTTLPVALRRHRPRLIFYVAGTDPLAGDPFGNFGLSLPGILARDRLVLAEARATAASLVITWGGGYGRDAWRASAQLVEWLLTGATTVRRRRAPEELRWRYARIADSLAPAELHGEGRGRELSESEVIGDLRQVGDRQHLVLGYYSAQGIELALQRYGFLDRLRERGFTDLRVDVDPRDRTGERISVSGRRGQGPRAILVDLVVRRITRPAPDHLAADPPLALLFVEWLQLQDPTSDFSLRRPPLPGQEHPGLGLSRETMELLYQACRRLELDGIAFHPSRYHIAVLGAPHCSFLDPVQQGRFDALREVLAGLELGAASRLLDEGGLHQRDGTPLRWEPAEYVAPVSQRLRAHLQSATYQEARAQARGELRDRGIAVHAAPPAP